MKWIAPFCLLAGFQFSAVSAQTIPPAPGGTTPSVPVCYTTAASSNCPALDTNIGSPGIGQYYVPLTSFALSSTTNALSAELAAFEIQQSKTAKVLSGGVAMSSALDLQQPTDGLNNRIGGGVSTFNGQGGLALTYSWRHDAWDAGLGVATSRYQNMAKAAVGFSW